MLRATRRRRRRRRRPSAARAVRSAACAVPAGFKGTVLRLNAELFQGIIAKPESWTALVAPERGALAVRDESGFVAMLAMKKGDRLEQANGMALAVPEDVVGAVLRPLASGDSVRILGSARRRGARMAAAERGHLSRVSRRRGPLASGSQSSRSSGRMIVPVAGQSAGSPAVPM